MNDKCPYCDKSVGNADYRATLHINAYHSLLEDIRERLDWWKNEAKKDYNDYDSIMDWNEPRLLKSLLQDEV